MTATQRYLRPVAGAHGLPLGASDGIQTLWGATETYSGYRDFDLKNWGLDIPGKPTSEILVDVHEQVVNGTNAQVLRSLGTPLDKLCFQQSQIGLFCRSFRNKLRTGGFATRFAFAKPGEEANEDGSNVFIAGVDVDGAGLGVDVFRFSSDGVWSVEFQYRFVIPQLGS